MKKVYVMVEVFRTNVKGSYQAKMVVGLIHKTFTDYKVNFDLEDCDKILRVKCITGNIDASGLIDLLSNSGVLAEVLPDELKLIH